MRSLAPTSPKLLLVDDHPPNLTALEAVFAPLGCQTIQASSGEEALRVLLDQDVACILLDVQMPGLDGFQTASLIRSRARSRDIPIIFLTAVSREKEYVFRGYEHGAVDYLVKPFHPDILRSKVAVFVDLFRKREQVRVQGEELLRREREMLERESALRYQHLMDCMPQCVWAAREDGNIYHVNRVWTEYTACDLARTVEAGWLDVVHEDDRGEASSRWQASLASGERFEMELRLRRGDGEHRWFLVRGVCQRDAAQALGWICTATDVDDQRRDREALTAAMAAKDDFLAAASHELRTPLAAAKAQVQLSQRRMDAERDPGTARALTIIATQIDRMSRLVEDLLDISRLQTGRLSLHLAEYDLAERIHAECERIQALTSQHFIALDIEAPLVLVADRDRIDQVLTNLLTNAVRYSPSGGRIVVRAFRDGDEIAVSVADSGIGIPLEKQGMIFERFGRAHGTRYGGLGLGLTIAQGIVEQHGGRIWVDSSGTPGEGATFHFRLPLRAEPRPTLPP